MRDATAWARSYPFNAEQCDCTTAVVLKILDGKCQMGEEEKEAVLALYAVTRELPGALFTAETHQLIVRAIAAESGVADTIHVLRLEAEARIPKTVMKGYKAVLRETLFMNEASQN